MQPLPPTLLQHLYIISLSLSCPEDCCCNNITYILIGFTATAPHPSPSGWRSTTLYRVTTTSLPPPQQLTHVLAIRISTVFRGRSGPGGCVSNCSGGLDVKLIIKSILLSREHTYTYMIYTVAFPSNHHLSAAALAPVSVYIYIHRATGGDVRVHIHTYKL